MPNGGRDLVFKTPLTESQVESQSFDLNFSFLDPIVQQQLSEGKTDYNPEKS